MLMPSLPENREPIWFRALPIEVRWMMAVAYGPPDADSDARINAFWRLLDL